MRLWLTVVLALLGVVIALVVRPLQTLMRSGGEASRRPQEKSDGDVGVLIHTVHTYPRRQEALVVALTGEDIRLRWSDARPFHKPTRASLRAALDTGKSATRDTRKEPAQLPSRCPMPGGAQFGGDPRRGVNAYPVAWSRGGQNRIRRASGIGRPGGKMHFPGVGPSIVGSCPDTNQFVTRFRPRREFCNSL